MIKEFKKRFIITILIDEEAQAFFTMQRNSYFPAYANVTPAHLTLFHSLPTHDEILNKIYDTCHSTKEFTMQVNELTYKNSFIAYAITSQELMQIHEILQNNFKPYLAAKDLKTLQPHITIQNKTTAYKAHKNYEIL
jgi:2'-5' RNA ligase